jgi:hypothetical protein
MTIGNLKTLRDVVDGEEEDDPLSYWYAWLETLNLSSVMVP